jgi:hypothetical protein
MACMDMQVLVGDVIYIEANSGAVKRVGRSDAFATEFDLEAEEYVPLPKGEVHKKKEIVQVGAMVALHLYIESYWFFLQHDLLRINCCSHAQCFVLWYIGCHTP